MSLVVSGVDVFLFPIYNVNIKYLFLLISVKYKARRVSVFILILDRVFLVVYVHF